MSNIGKPCLATMNFPRSGFPCALPRRGFTLMELLAVITVAAILIALVFAAGSSAIHTGKVIKCSANMRQLGLAFSQYLTDNGGRLPCTGTEPGNTATWDMQIMGYLDNSGYNFLGVTAAGTFSKTVPLSSASIFKCPADVQPRAPDNYPRSYCMLSWTCNYGRHYSASLPENVGIRILQLHAPARSVVLAECPAPSPAGTHGNVLGCGSFSVNGVQYIWSEIHHKKANFLFADWHVELIPQKKTLDGPMLYARYFPPESDLCIANGGPIPQ